MGASDTSGGASLGGSQDPIESVLGGGYTTSADPNAPVSSSGGGLGGLLGGLFGGSSSGSSSGGGSNQQLLNTVLTQLLGQQRVGFGGSFVGAPSIASGRAQAPAFGPPALEGGGGRASSPLERLALAMAALR